MKAGLDITFVGIEFRDVKDYWSIKIIILRLNEDLMICFEIILICREVSRSFLYKDQNLIKNQFKNI